MTLVVSTNYRRIGARMENERRKAETAATGVPRALNLPTAKEYLEMCRSALENAVRGR